MIVRAAAPGDHAGIAQLVRAAFTAEFGRSDEPELVARLRELGDVVREDVAEADGALVGHILFSRAFVGAHPVVQLAPVCAAVGRQRDGIGGLLIRQGLEALQAAGETHVFVLGHPAYYPRFGFSPDAARPFAAPWSGPHHMLRRLAPGGPESGALAASKAFG